MKKIIFILCTALCLPFISCSNDDALDEALTRGEQIENDYKKSLNHACEVLNDNEFPSENKFNTDLLVGTWKRTDITAEIYIDGEKRMIHGVLIGVSKRFSILLRVALNMKLLL